MKIKYSSQLAELTFDAALMVFNRKASFLRFLSSMGVEEHLLSFFDANETKRAFLERLLPKMQSTACGKTIILEMALELSKFMEFPDLRGFEDSSLKERKARDAVSSLNKFIAEQNRNIADENEKKMRQDAARNDAEAKKKERIGLDSFESRLSDLKLRLGTQEAGYDFQVWFYDLIDFFEIQCRRPYTTTGRQIDGSVSVNNTEYLVELKFQKKQADAQDIDSIHAKLRDKADNTMAVLFAMSGFSSVAISEASKGRTMVLLFNYNHIYLLLRGGICFSELVDRVKRHAAQTGEAFLAVSDMA